MKQFGVQTLMLIIALWFSNAAVGQSSLSLDDATTAAMQLNAKLQNASLGVSKAIAQKNEVRGTGLPQVTASFDLKDYLKLPTSLIPAEFFGGQPGEYAEVQFGTQYNITTGINASQLLFSGEYIVALQASQAYIQFAEQEQQKSKVEVITAVQKAYFAALITEERFDILNENLSRLESMKMEIEKMYDAGFVEKVDLDRITGTYNNLVTERNNIQKLLNLTYMSLNLQMGEELDTKWDLTENLDDQLTRIGQTNLMEGHYSERADYQLLQTGLRLAELDYKRYQYSKIPTIALYGSYNWQAQRNELFGSSQKKWFPIGLIGFTINANLFTGLSQDYRSERAQLDVMTTSNNVNEMERAMSLEIQNAKITLENSMNSIENQKTNIELAQSIVDRTNIKFKAGTATSMEVIEAENALTEAQSNYINALYSAILAKIDFDKATGKIGQ